MKNDVCLKTREIKYFLNIEDNTWAHFSSLDEIDSFLKKNMEDGAEWFIRAEYMSEEDVRKLPNIDGEVIKEV